MSADVDIFQRRERVKKPGWRKALPWLIGAAVVVAVIGVLVWKYSDTGTSLETPLSTLAADDRSQVPKTAKLDPDARRVARDFIKTAVARKNLGAAYPLAGPMIRQDQTLKEWMTGNIAVIPYPVDAVEFAPMKIDYSYPREAQIQVALLPKDGANVKSQLFIATLVKNGQGQWQVNSWVPRSSPMIPSGSENNGGG
ncbi:MAG TPA: hypothetical protein VKB10_10060 [Gaiellaceae bacterium]|nr:hypothetical protein [Gaiellaceae bacterium]